MKTWLVLNDIQIPWQDKPVLQMIVDFAADLKPYGVVLNGDVTDCYLISDYAKDPSRVKVWGLKREIAEAGQLMSAFKYAKERWWLGGNHEDRWRRIQWQFPNLEGALQHYDVAFHMADYGFQWKPYGGVLHLGKLFVTHGALVSKHSAQTARFTYEKYGNSVLVGHTHRLGVFYRTNAKGIHAAYENGCVCRLTPEYVQCPDWQQGFSVVHVEDGGWFNVQQIPILKRSRFFYGGTLVKAGGRR